MVVGLGNPGSTYADSRHNIGFMVTDALARRLGVDFVEHGLCRVSPPTAVDGVPVVLVQPLDYMNRSGPPLVAVARRFSLTCRDLVIVHDDLDLAFGRLKIKEKGGDGGHKGVRSIMDAFACDDFIRLRVGIGRPGAGTAVIDHVLGVFSPDEQADLEPLVTRAAEAIVTVLGQGPRAAMARFHVRRTEQPS